MTTPSLTLADFALGTKYSAIQAAINPKILELINKSEVLKEQFRAYERDTKSDAVVLNSSTATGAASYTVPSLNRATNEIERGFITLGSATIDTPEKFIKILSHELGHHGVEGPGSVIGNARANAAAASDKAAYAAACHLTEGYARLATVKVIEEISNSDLNVNVLENFQIVGALTSLEEYKNYLALNPGISQLTWTYPERDATMAFALGESNRSNLTSTSNQTYLNYCSISANAVISGGAAPANNAPSNLSTSLSYELGSDTSGVTTSNAGGSVLNIFSESNTTQLLQIQTTSGAPICRREDYTVSPVGLPTTASYTFRAGFDSELTGKEVVSTAGNGLTTQISSLFDVQSHITVANSALASTADLSQRTITAQQANGTYVQDAWHYNAAGIATGHELAHLSANKSMMDITAYDASGQADTSTSFSPDGSSVVYGYDNCKKHRLIMSLKSLRIASNDHASYDDC